MPNANATETKILEVGRELIQQRGPEDFSYRDVADRVGIQSATIHYYFPAKDDLVVAVATQYRADFADSLAEIDANAKLTALDKVERFAGIFREVLGKGRVCLCGMLASGTGSQTEAVNQQAREFFGDLHRWLEATFAAGAEDGSIQRLENPARTARSSVAALEGAMLIAYNSGDATQLDDVIAEMIDGLASS